VGTHLLTEAGGVGPRRRKSGTEETSAAPGGSNARTSNHATKRTVGKGKID